ncbi:MAG: MMPL family transporter [Anaerolineae bacterium]|nr:MMPL family transporter [Phycisphaerae bacterium]
MNHLLSWPVHRPRSALLAAAAMTIVSLALMFTRLHPETSFQALLDKTDPAVVAMGRVLEQFPVGNELLVLASLPDDAKQADPAQLLAFADRLQSAVARDESTKSLITHVRFRADPRTRAFVEQVVIPNGLYYLDQSQLAAVTHRLTREGMIEQLARTKDMLAQPGPAAGGLAKTLAKDPLNLREFLTSRLSSLTIPGGGAFNESNAAFFSPDRRSLLIRIGGVKSSNDFNFGRDLTSAVQRLADAENQEHLRLDITGAYAMAAHSAEQIKADSISDVVTTIVGLVLLFVIACRRPIRLFTFAFVPVAAGLIWGFGAYAMIRQTITPLAMVVGGTLGAIGLDYTIHFIAHYQEIRATSSSVADAVRRTIRELFFPSLAAWLTSVIGFAAVAISPIGVLRDFAILGTLCLAGAWLATLLVLPAMLVIWPHSREASPFAIRFEITGAIGQWIARRARRILVCSTVVIALLAGTLVVRGVHFPLDSDPMVMHPQPSPPLDAQRRIAKKMQIAGGSLIVHLHAGSPSDLVAQSHDVQKRLDNEAVRSAGVVNSFGIASLLPDPCTDAKRGENINVVRMKQDFRAALEETGFVPEAYESYTAFLEKLAAPGGPPDASILKDYGDFGQLLLPRDVLDRGAPATEAVTLLFTNAPMETRDARETALAAVRDALADLPGVAVTGTATIGHDLEHAIHRDLPRFVGISLVCIAAYLLIHFRSIKLAAMALLPIAISLLAVIACISLFDLRITLLHTVMAPLLLGINLDYGIFAVHAYQSSRDQRDLGGHFPASFAALIICGGSTTIGFGSLVITSIPAVKSLGWLINVGVGSCVLATLFVLWPIIMLSRKARQTTALRETPVAG